MKLLIQLAGVGQLLLVLGSLAIPRVLGWREETAKLRPLTREVFWTWAAYVWTAHLSFGLLSVLGPGLLTDRTPLAAAVTGFIAAWWWARLVIQFACFDRSARPPGAIFVLAEAALVACFAGCAAVYGAACWTNLRG